MRAFVLCLAVLTACSPRPAEQSTQLLVDFTDRTLLPAYDVATTDALGLAGAASNYCGSVDAAGLVAVQTAWRTARSSWELTLAFKFGPAEIRQTEARVDRWPTSAEALDGVLAGSGLITLESVSALGVNKLGFPAVEYLLFRRDADHAQELAGFTSSPRRCELLRVLTTAIHEEILQVRDAWGNSYRTEFTTAGAGSATYPTVKSGVDQMVNQLIATLETIVRSQMATPLGLSGDGTPQPAKTNSGFSGTAATDMLATLAGLEAAYLGGGGLTLSDQVKEKDAPVDARVRAAFTSARTGIESVQSPWDQAVSTERAGAEAAYQRVRELKRLLGTEVVATLGVTLTFNDSDGD